MVRQEGAMPPEDAFHFCGVFASCLFGGKCEPARAAFLNEISVAFVGWLFCCPSSLFSWVLSERIDTARENSNDGVGPPQSYTLSSSRYVVLATRRE